MPASKLKNLIILILLLANVFLLALAVPSYLEERAQRETADSELAALFAQADVTLEQAIPPTLPLYLQEASCAPADNLAAVTALLGEQVVAEGQAYRTDYQGAGGTAYLRADGVFHAEPTAITASDTMLATERLLRAFGGEWTALERSGETLSAACVLDGAPVLSHRVTFSWRGDTLASVSGRLFAPATAHRLRQTQCCTARDALLDFLASRMELGWVGSRIESVSQGYVLTESAAASTVQIVPSWQIETDGGTFFVDGITRAVTPADG